MKIKLLFLFLFFSLISFAQNKPIIGNILGENDEYISGITVFNTRTEQKSFPDNHGIFLIEAQTYDELRIVKEGYETKYLKISKNDFEKSLKIILIKLPIEIEEVQLAFHPTGDLKKDMNQLKPSKRKEELNENIRLSLRNAPKDVPPSLQAPSAFKTHDFNAGQVDVLGVVGLLAKGVSSIFGGNKSQPKLNTLDKQDFYAKVKNAVDLEYFYKFGLDEYDFGIFLIYADKNLKLSEKYAYNFNPKLIEQDLKAILEDYLKTHKTHG